VANSKSSQSQSSASAPDAIWYSRCGAATASAIAIRKKWLHEEFARDGIELRSLRDSDEKAVLDAHYHHRLPGLFREGGNIPPIWARAGGSDTAVVGITWLDEYQGILGRKRGPIGDIGDLAGKRLALPVHDNLIDFRRGAAQHAFVTALRLAGRDARDATFVDVPAPARARGDREPATPFEIDALLAGQVDAVFVRFARGARVARDARLHPVINLNDQPDPLTRVGNGTPRPITVDRAFLDEHPDLVVRYLAVLLRVAAWAQRHPDEVLRLLAEEGGADSVEDVVASHGSKVHHGFVPRLSRQTVDGLELQKNFLRDHGYLKSDFSIHEWVVREPLVEAEALVARDPRPFETPRSKAAGGAVGARLA
jgi:sulfonate transport system substrate-binding protein